MPAAAVIPAPIAYIKVVAVKKLVVGFWACSAGRVARRVAGSVPLGGRGSTGWACLHHGAHGGWGGSPPLSRGSLSLLKTRRVLHGACRGFRTFTLKKLECSKQAFARIH